MYLLCIMLYFMRYSSKKNFLYETEFLVKLFFICILKLSRGWQPWTVPTSSKQNVQWPVKYSKSQGQLALAYLPNKIVAISSTWPPPILSKPTVNYCNFLCIRNYSFLKQKLILMITLVKKNIAQTILEIFNQLMQILGCKYVCE